MFKKAQKPMMYKKIFIVLSILILLLGLELISAGIVTLKVTPLSGDGAITPDTAYTYDFNWTTSSDCSGVVFSNSSISLTTNKSGSASIRLIVPDNPTSIPTHLCEYRYGPLRAIRELPS